jgi:ABC-type phosphate/phosphonate transport system substrate-binding protein
MVETMVLTDEQKEEQRVKFEEAAKPLMKFLSDNFNPHVMIIVTSTNAEIVEGLASFNTVEFVRD